MKVLIIANSDHVIPPINYGGTERVIAALCQGLVDNGHDVRLISSKYSRIDGCSHFSLFENGKSLFRRLLCRAQFQIITAIASRGVDLVHSYKCWPEYHSYLNRSRLPLLYTQQNQLTSQFLSRVLSAKKNSYIQCISSDQAKVVDSSRLGRDVFICHNPTATDAIIPPRNPSRSYLAYLGRLNYDKGIDIAVKVSLASGIPLKIAGVIRPDEGDAQKLFDSAVRPYLGDQIEYVGPVCDEEKSEFLGNAIALLMLNRWAEPFGIVMAESLAAGTPIVGTRKGSIPEIIDHGKTGYLVDDISCIEEIVAAIAQCKHIDSAACRSAAVERFSREVFCAGIEKIYRSILSGVS